MGVTVLESSHAADAAAAALAMVGASPRDAQDAALEARRVSRRQHDRAAESVAGRALGLARKELGDLVGARAALRDAVRVADGAGLDRVAAEARMSLAFVLLDSGRVTGALAQADRAVSALRGTAAARLRAQRGLILQRCGRLTEAQAAYQLALPVLARAGDRVWEARLRNNRGLLRAFQGSLTAAEADLRRAAELHTGLGNQLLAADCTWNLGFVAARRGDAPAALACYDATEATYREAGVPAPELLLDRAEVLLSVGLNGEAATAAAEAAGVMARLGLLTHLAEAWLVQAQAALAGGDPDDGRLVRRPGRGCVPAPATTGLGTGRPARRRLRGLRKRIDGPGHAGEVPAYGRCPQRCRLGRARTGRADHHRRDGARAGSRQRGGGPAAPSSGSPAARQRRRARRGLARRGPVARGDRSARLRRPALRAGLRVLDEHRAALGATELRVHAATHGARLAALGLRLATRGCRRGPGADLGGAVARGHLEAAPGATPG